MERVTHSSSQNNLLSLGSDDGERAVVDTVSGEDDGQHLEELTLQLVEVRKRFSGKNTTSCRIEVTFITCFLQFRVRRGGNPGVPVGDSGRRIRAYQLTWSVS